MITKQQKGNRFGSIVLLICLVTITGFIHAQADSTAVSDTNTYRILKTDGSELIGKILSQDEREIYLLTEDKRKIYVPQYVIKEISVISPTEYNNKGEYIGEDKFATRYFITTNGLPIKKGEHYVQWNLFGPDFQFAVGDNFGLGVMTSWFAVPIIGTAKYSFQLKGKSQLAIGTMLGTTSWAAFTDFNGGGVLPFASYSYGTRRANLAVSAGYGAIWADGDIEGRALSSVAGMIKIGKKISLVFDSFIVLPGPMRTITNTYTEYVYNPSTMVYDPVIMTETYSERRPGLALIIPGLRWHLEEGKAFQFGFTGVVYDNELLPVPIPMVQWYRSL